MAARVRIVHASPNAPAVDIWVDGKRALTNLSYPNDTGYVDLPAGSHQIAVSAAGADQPVLGPMSVTLEDGEAYTVIAHGLLGGSPPLAVKILLDGRMRQAKAA